MKAARVKVIITFPPDEEGGTSRSYEEEMLDCDVEIDEEYDAEHGRVDTLTLRAWR